MNGAKPISSNCGKSSIMIRDPRLILAAMAFWLLVALAMWAMGYSPHSPIN